MLALNQPRQTLNDVQEYNLSLAMTAAVKFVVVLAKWETRYRTRKQLLHLTDAQLHDIGITPRAADIEARRWFWQT